MGDGLLGKLVLIGLGAGGVILWNKLEDDKKAKANPEDEIEDRLRQRIRELDARDHALVMGRY